VSASFSLSTRTSQGILKIGERRLKNKRSVRFTDETVFKEKQEKSDKIIHRSDRAQKANIRFYGSKYFELNWNDKGFLSSLKSNPYIDPPLYIKGRPIPLRANDSKTHKKTTDEYTSNQLIPSQEESPFQDCEPESSFSCRSIFDDSSPYCLPFMGIFYVVENIETYVTSLFCFTIMH
jgi:hypothetical protein